MNTTTRMNIETQIYQRFHVIDDRKTILLYNLTKLNRLQNDFHLIEMDMKENGLFYDYHQREEFENKNMEKQIAIVELANRCIEDIEGLIFETSNIVDMTQHVNDVEDMTRLFSEKYVPFIEGISNLESLFLSDLPQIQEMLNKMKMFGEILQNVLHFEIQVENIKPNKLFE